MAIRGCEREWEAVEATLERLNTAHSQHVEILNTQPGTLDTLKASRDARRIAKAAYEEWERALDAFSACADRVQASN